MVKIRQLKPVGSGKRKIVYSKSKLTKSMKQDVKLAPTSLLVYLFSQAENINIYSIINN